ncbi:MAG TPA: hypothetical protein VHO66_10570, partial [Ruminiclostridium sp.]|nr:hypothetical protein [Ruminiclostridium sp.]
RSYLMLFLLKRESIFYTTTVCNFINSDKKSLLIFSGLKGTASTKHFVALRRDRRFLCSAKERKGGFGLPPLVPCLPIRKMGASILNHLCSLRGGQT